MTAGIRLSQHPRLRAPQDDRGILCDPPLDAVGDLVRANVALGAQADIDIQGRPLSQLAQSAHAELIAAARAYTSTYRSVDSGPPRSGFEWVTLAGHQAEIFHPGVWAKNFSLGGIGPRTGAAAINLLVDSDTVKQTGLWVPGGTVDRPTRRRLFFDHHRPEIPSEESTVVDQDLWRTFGQRVAAEISTLVPEPLIEKYWPLVLERTAAGEKPGAALCQARHLLEGQWGLDTLELPLSWTCRFESFHWFTAHLLAQLPRLRPLYNATVADYRRANRIRSQNHPVPDLAEEGGWLEAPFWIWTAGDPRRRRLFARQQADQLLLTDRAGIELRLPLTADGDARGAVEVLADAAARGIKIRTRALTTTLWARLVLGDLFVHGIGGATYDQLTDVLIANFFGREPPGFLTFSATLYLPVPQPPVSEDDLRRVEGQLRELTFNPDRRLDPSMLDAAPLDAPAESGAKLPELLAEKRRLIETAVDGTQGRRRCFEIRRVNAALQPWVARQRQWLLTEQEATRRALGAARVLRSREYAFCLYPEKYLRDFMLAIGPTTL